MKCFQMNYNSFGSFLFLYINKEISMKDITKYITEHKHCSMNDVKAAIKDIFDTKKKKMNPKDFKTWVFNICEETRDDIDAQDNHIYDRDLSTTWKLIKEVARILDVDVYDLWEDCDGSYLFIETIQDLDK